jgi:hypothetical protein
MACECFRLTDGQFARLKPYLPTETRGVPRVDLRRVISRTVHVPRSVWPKLAYPIAGRHHAVRSGNP